MAIWLSAITGNTNAAETTELQALLEQVSTNRLEIAARTASERRNAAPAQENSVRERFTNVMSDNFVVGAPTRKLAESILATAEEFRRELAIEWLGGELADGQEFANIHVEITDEVDEGLTLLAGEGRQLPGDNRVWLRTSAAGATGSTLRHEMTHVVLAAGFEYSMPAWANEGIASRYDDVTRHEIRQQIVSEFGQTRQWPQLEKVMNAASIVPSDQAAYAVSVSLTDYLLELGDRPSFIAFLRSAEAIGWNASLRKYYRIDDCTSLQQQWQQWVLGRIAEASDTR